MQGVQICLKFRNTFVIPDEYKNIKNKEVNKIIIKESVLKTSFNLESIKMQKINLINKEEENLITIFVEDTSLAKKVYNYWNNLLGTEAKINQAILKMEAFLKVEYEPETTKELRTGNNPEAIAKMDCSEFVCRYLKEMGITNQVELMNTDGLSIYAEKKDNLFTTHNDKNYIPQKGDIFIWKKGDANNTSGHTGIVESYNPSTQVLTIIDASTDTKQVSKRTMKLEHILKTHQGIFYSPKL